MELLIALIPALPLAGFLFTVAVGPFLDHVPVHGHGAGDHGPGDHESAGHGTAAHEPSTALETHDAHAHADESGFRTVPSEEEQRLTSPHAGHADDLANTEGADGVIPPDIADGRGQTGHVAPGTERPRYRSWIVPVVLVGIGRPSTSRSTRGSWLATST